MESSDLSAGEKKTRWGYTTGTCAAAASLAAALMLLTGEMREQITVLTPSGKEMCLETEDIRRDKTRVTCAVRKDAGDDPDVTDNLLIYASVSKGDCPPDIAGGDKSGYYVWENDRNYLKLYGGVGIGIVTKPGLSCEVGKPAINPVPRSMIFEQVAAACARAAYEGKLSIVISVPDGEEIAKRTFNPKLGITGGISILGTSGEVEPMSQRALLETIRLELRQKHLDGRDRLILTPGNYGEMFLQDSLGISLEYAVKCSNFIGDSIDMAAQEGIRQILLVGHAGKLIKVAAGIMNTHSLVADGRMEILAAYSGACGAGKELLEEVLASVSVDQGLSVLERQPGLREQVMGRIMERMDWHLRSRAAGRLEIEAIMFTNERGILGETSGAERIRAWYTL